jgi:hypothetical protein
MPLIKNGLTYTKNYEIATLRPEHHAVQGFARNDKILRRT